MAGIPGDTLYWIGTLVTVHVRRRDWLGMVCWGAHFWEIWRMGGCFRMRGSVTRRITWKNLSAAKDLCVHPSTYITHTHSAWQFFVLYTSYHHPQNRRRSSSVTRVSSAHSNTGMVQKSSHGRGGAGNIAVETVKYVDGLNYSPPILSVPPSPSPSPPFQNNN